MMYVLTFDPNSMFIRRKLKRTSLSYLMTLCVSDTQVFSIYSVQHKTSDVNLSHFCLGADDGWEDCDDEINTTAKRYVPK